MPPAEEAAASATFSSVMVSLTPPANAVEAATVKAAASAIYFMVFSSYSVLTNFSRGGNTRLKLFLMLLL
jgi:hypothetical protein